MTGGRQRGKGPARPFLPLPPPGVTPPHPCCGPTPRLPHPSSLGATLPNQMLAPKLSPWVPFAREPGLRPSVPKVVPESGVTPRLPRMQGCPERLAALESRSSGTGPGSRTAHWSGGHRGSIAGGSEAATLGAAAFARG